MLVVTGADPGQGALAGHPLWQGLGALVDWAVQSKMPVVWSCLAAHVAVGHLDGLATRRRPVKFSGLFDCATVGPDPLLDGLNGVWPVPHSRYNDLDEAELVARGYAMLTRSDVVGADTFIRRGDPRFLFCQGHLEYDANSLALEYKRDFRDFVSGQRDSLPAPPVGALLDREGRESRGGALRRRPPWNSRSPDLVDQWPSEVELTRNVCPWRPFAVGLYRNWLRARPLRIGRSKADRRRRQMRRETIAIHGGFDGDPATGAAAVPIHQTAAFLFDSADHGAALFNLEVEGFRYSRISNPTTAVLEKRVAAMEGGVGALAVASGQAALYYAIANVADRGGNIVCTPQLYGTTHTLLAHVLPKQGIQARFAADDSAAAVAALIDDETRAVFCESVGNPAGNICDIAALAKAAHDRGVPLIVDNTVATPVLLRPIEHGADIVIHSLTKFMGGHGVAMGGAIVDSGRFDWRAHADRFPMFSQPDVSYHGLVYALIISASGPISSAAAASISGPWARCWRR